MSYTFKKNLTIASTIEVHHTNVYALPITLISDGKPVSLSKTCVCDRYRDYDGTLVLIHKGFRHTGGTRERYFLPIDQSALWPWVMHSATHSDGTPVRIYRRLHPDLWRKL